MVRLETISTLSELEREMARAGRAAEQEALRTALHALARPERGFLTTGQAAERLGVSIPTVKRWLQRDTLAGYTLGSRHFVTVEGVDRLVSLREALRAVDQEGNPTPEEILQLD